MSMSTLGTELSPLRSFFAVVAEVGASARDRGEFGEGGGAVYSLDEWQRFIAAARSAGHPPLLGNAIHRTVINVERMLEDRKSPRQIHAALYWLARKDESEQEKRAVEERREDARIAARERENAIEALKKQELVKLEARDRARAEMDERREGGSGRRRRVESNL